MYRTRKKACALGIFVWGICRGTNSVFYRFFCIILPYTRYLKYIIRYTICYIITYLCSRIRNVCKIHSAKNIIDGIKVNATIIMTVHLHNVARSIYGGGFFARIKFFAKTVGGNKLHARKNFLRSTVDVCAGIYTYELRIILYDGTRPSERVRIFDTRSVAFLFFFVFLFLHV